MLIGLKLLVHCEFKLLWLRLAFYPQALLPPKQTSKDYSKINSTLGIMQKGAILSWAKFLVAYHTSRTDHSNSAFFH